MAQLSLCIYLSISYDDSSMAAAFVTLSSDELTLSGVELKLSSIGLTLSSAGLTDEFHRTDG